MSGKMSSSFPEETVERFSEKVIGGLEGKEFAYSVCEMIHYFSKLLVGLANEIREKLKVSENGPMREPVNRTMERTRFGVR